MTESTCCDTQGVVLDWESGRRMGLNYPGCFIIGAAKSATTLLYNQLSEHPDVGRGEIKEPRYFADDAKYRKGLGYYSSLYQRSHDGQILIDGSTDYARRTYHPHVAERMHLAVPDARMVYVVRHPIDRAFSHYAHRWTKVLHPGEPFSETFEEFVKHEPICLDDSRYRMQIEPYLATFDRNQIRVIIHDDVATDKSAVLEGVCGFFGLRYETGLFGAVSGNQSNVGSDHRTGVARRLVGEKIRSTKLGRIAMAKMPNGLRRRGFELLSLLSGRVRKLSKGFTPLPMLPETRRRLAEEYEQDIAWVEEATGRSLPHWRE